MKNWWRTDEELLKTTTDYHRLPLTDWFYSIEQFTSLESYLRGMDGWMDICIPDSTNYKSTASGANKSSGKSHLVIKAKELIFFKEAIASDVLPVSMFFKFFVGKCLSFWSSLIKLLGRRALEKMQPKVLDFLAVENNFECLCAPLLVYHPLEKIYTFHFQTYHGKIVFKGLWLLKIGYLRVGSFILRGNPIIIFHMSWINGNLGGGGAGNGLSGVPFRTSILL